MAQRDAVVVTERNGVVFGGLMIPLIRIGKTKDSRLMKQADEEAERISEEMMELDSVQAKEVYHFIITSISSMCLGYLPEKPNNRKITKSVAKSARSILTKEFDSIQLPSGIIDGSHKMSTTQRIVWNDINECIKKLKEGSLTGYSTLVESSMVVPRNAQSYKALLTDAITIFSAMAGSDV